MKAFASCSKFAVFAMAILAVSVLGLQAQPNNVTAKVRAVRGSAKYSDNGSWHTVRVNDSLKVGSVIQTGADSTVDLFINDSVIRITPETTFGITKAMATDTGTETVTETELYLKSGRILGNVKKLAAASKYQIKTPNGVTGIRGTKYVISYLPVAGGWKKTVYCLEGTVLASAANLRGDIQSAVINAGESWSPDEGIVPTPPDFDPSMPEFIDPTVDNTAPVPQPDRVIIREEPDLGISPSSP